MRNKKMSKKLDLNKVTIANLEMNNIRGGATRTCETIEDPCLTEVLIYCASESCG